MAEIVPENCFCVHNGLGGCAIGLCWTFHSVSLAAWVPVWALALKALGKKYRIKSPINASVLLLLMIFGTATSKIVYQSVLMSAAGRKSDSLGEVSPLYGVDVAANSFLALLNMFFCMTFYLLLYVWWRLYTRVNRSFSGRAPVIFTAGHCIGAIIHAFSLVIGCEISIEACNVISTPYLFLSAYFAIACGIGCVYFSFVLYKKTANVDGASGKVRDHLKNLTKAARMIAGIVCVFVFCVAVATLLRAITDVSLYDASYIVEIFLWGLLQMACISVALYFFGFSQSKDAQRDAAEDETQQHKSSVLGSGSADSRSRSASGSASASVSAAV